MLATPTTAPSEKEAAVREIIVILIIGGFFFCNGLKEILKPQIREPVVTRDKTSTTE